MCVENENVYLKVPPPRSSKTVDEMLNLHY